MSSTKTKEATPRGAMLKKQESKNRIKINNIDSEARWSMVKKNLGKVANIDGGMKGQASPID